MYENPYEPPQSLSEVRPRPKAVAGLSLLALLVVPSAAIAGSATCFGTIAAFRIQGLIPISLGFGICLLLVVGALSLLRMNGPGLDPQDLGRAVVLVLAWQLIAIPISLIVGLLGFALLYMVYSVRRDEWGMMPLALTISFATYFISSAVAYRVWHSSFHDQEPP